MVFCILYKFGPKRRDFFIAKITSSKAEVCSCYHKLVNQYSLKLPKYSPCLVEVVYYGHTTMTSSCLPSKFCISRRQALKEPFVVSSTQMRAASYSLPSLRCSEVTRTTGASENLSCNIKNREIFRETSLQLLIEKVIASF